MHWPTSAKLGMLSVSLVALASLALNAHFLRLETQRRPVIEPPEIVELVSRHFPVEYASPNNPEDQLLLLVLNRSKEVLKKGVGRIAPDLDLLSSIRLLSPGLELGAKGSAGSMCFPAEQGKHGKFCVGWAISTT